VADTGGDASEDAPASPPDDASATKNNPAQETGTDAAHTESVPGFGVSVRYRWTFCGCVQ